MAILALVKVCRAFREVAAKLTLSASSLSSNRPLSDPSSLTSCWFLACAWPSSPLDRGSCQVFLCRWGSIRRTDHQVHSGAAQRIPTPHRRYRRAHPLGFPLFDPNQSGWERLDPDVRGGGVRFAGDESCSCDTALGAVPGVPAVPDVDSCCESRSPRTWTDEQSLYEDEDISSSTRYPAEIANLPGRIRAYRRRRKDEEIVIAEEPAPTDGHPVNDGPIQVPQTGEKEHEEEDEEQPQMNIWATIVSCISGQGPAAPHSHVLIPQIVLLLVTGFVGVTAEFLVSSINGLVESNPALSAEWVGLILLPIVSPPSVYVSWTSLTVQVGNAAEHFTAVSVSVKDKLDLSISVAVGIAYTYRYFH